MRIHPNHAGAVLNAGDDNKVRRDVIKLVRIAVIPSDNHCLKQVPCNETTALMHIVNATQSELILLECISSVC